jgi:hypothetical protein
MRPIVAIVLVAAAGCVPPQENPTTVRDMRVLGVSLEPPEVMLKGCDASLLLGLARPADGGVPSLDPKLLAGLLQAAALPLDFRALIADPAGDGRALEYALRACASTGDRTCSNEGDFVELARGEAGTGELQLWVLPAIQVLDDGSQTPLVLEVLNQDFYKGLGGIRVPLVLELSSPDGTERLYAQKLMVYSCQLFPEREANLTPHLPGILWEGEEWPEDVAKEYAGTASVELAIMDVAPLQEAYVVPGLTLERVELVESWKVNWMTTSGTMSAYVTGGTDFAGETGRHRSSWSPDPSVTDAQDVTLYFVVRDGRGGESWTTRRVHWSP